jgi:hypothetical protein
MSEHMPPVSADVLGRDDPAGTYEQEATRLDYPRARHPVKGRAAARGQTGFVLLPRRWVAERSFAWEARFRRLARDYERLPTVLAGRHFIAFACLLRHQVIPLISRPSPALGALQQVHVMRGRAYEVVS